MECNSVADGTHGWSQVDLIRNGGVRWPLGGVCLRGRRQVWLLGQSTSQVEAQCHQVLGIGHKLNNGSVFVLY